MFYRRGFCRLRFVVDSALCKNPSARVQRDSFYQRRRFSCRPPFPLAPTTISFSSLPFCAPRCSARYDNQASSHAPALYTSLFRLLRKKPRDQLMFPLCAPALFPFRLPLVMHNKYLSRSSSGRDGRIARTYVNGIINDRACRAVAFVKTCRQSIVTITSPL